MTARLIQLNLASRQLAQETEEHSARPHNRWKLKNDSIHGCNPLDGRRQL
jgi:hypothetical protein